MLSIKWARNLRKSMDQVEITGPTTKREKNPVRTSFYLGKEIAKAVFEHKTPSDFILSFDQTPFLGFTSPLEATYKKGNSRIVPIANSDNKLQITGTFTVNLLGKFLPIQLIYARTINLCRPKVKFLSGFDITH